MYSYQAIVRLWSEDNLYITVKLSSFEKGLMFTLAKFFKDNCHRFILWRIHTPRITFLG